jgi:uncharacterized membrane protein
MSDTILALIFIALLITAGVLMFRNGDYPKVN